MLQQIKKRKEFFKDKHKCFCASAVVLTLANQRLKLKQQMVMLTEKYCTFECLDDLVKTLLVLFTVQNIWGGIYPLLTTVVSWCS